MQNKNTEIINVKKLKKDGFIDEETFRRVAKLLLNDKKIIMPIDFIYGVIALDVDDNLQKVTEIANASKKNIVHLISTFKMLDEIAIIDKLEFDFLHRIWPGEMVVHLQRRDVKNKTIPLQMPKGKLYQELINIINNPIIFIPLVKPNDHLIYQKKVLIENYNKKADCIFIIEEFCKDHTLPSVLDISNGTLEILNEGRISSDEIKSLYFLGKDDSVV